MIELVLSHPDFARLVADLTAGSSERCAILFAAEVRRSDRTRLLVREVEFAAEKDYVSRGPLHAQLKPQVVADATKKARRNSLILVFAHSHPGSEPPVFSMVDDEGEALLSDFLASRYPQTLHAAIVVTQGGVRARVLGATTEIRVVSIGASRHVAFDPMEEMNAVNEAFDRQVRAFGRVGQRSLEDLRVGVVGVGGTGSIVAQQLAHLGIRSFLLIDPDSIEESNLNRVNFVGRADIGKAKVDVAAGYIKHVAPDADVMAVHGDVVHARTADLLVETDLFFGCTDSHGSRAVMQQVAYQYLIPCIDLGTTIVAKQGVVHNVTGRVQLLAPGHACFTCGGLLDSNEVRRDMMSAFERKTDPYIVGDREPAPSVMSINGAVSSLAVTMFLSVVARVPGSARHLVYNALAPSLRSVRFSQNESCFVCSRHGALARGDSIRLSARQD